MRIDSHVRFWEIGRGWYDWITPDLKALERDFFAAGPEYRSWGCTDRGRHPRAEQYMEPTCRSVKTGVLIGRARPGISGSSRVMTSGLLFGPARLTSATALAIERLDRGDAEYWMRLQASYDLAKLWSGAAIFATASAGERASQTTKSAGRPTAIP